MSKIIVTVEDYRSAPFTRRNVREGQSDEGHYARLRGRAADGRYVSSVAWDAGARRLDSELGRLTPEGIEISDMRFALELTGEDRMVERKDKRGMERVFFIAAENGFTVLTGPAQELHRARTSGAAVHAAAADLAAAGNLQAAFDKLREFVGRFSRVVVDDTVELEASAPDPVASDEPPAVRIQDDGPGEAGDPVDGMAADAEPVPVPVPDGVSVPEAATDEVATAGAVSVPEVDERESVAAGHSVSIPEASIPEASPSTEAGGGPEPADVAGTVGATLVADVPVVEDATPVPPVEAVHADVDPVGGLVTSDAAPDVAVVMPLAADVPEEAPPAVSQVVATPTPVVPLPAVAVETIASAVAIAPSRRRASSMASRPVDEREEPVELPGEAPEIAAAREFGDADPAPSLAASQGETRAAPVSLRRSSMIGNPSVAPAQQAPSAGPAPRSSGTFNRPQVSRPGVAPTSPPATVAPAARVQTAAPANVPLVAVADSAPATPARPPAFGRPFGGNAFARPQAAGMGRNGR